MSLTGPIVVGICGGTGSGKTTLCEAIVGRFGSEISVISQDMYYLDLSHMNLTQRGRQNFDHPDAFDQELFRADLKSIKQGNAIRPPLYDFVSHTRIGKSALMVPGTVVLAEGIMLFSDPEVRDLIDYKIYIDTPFNLRFTRRLERDLNQRGRTIESVISQWFSSVKPMHDKYVEPNKRFADLVVQGTNLEFVLDKVKHISGLKEMRIYLRPNSPTASIYTPLPRRQER